MRPSVSIKMRTVILLAGNLELRFRNEAEAAQTYSSVLKILENLKMPTKALQHQPGQRKHHNILAGATK
jgi:hypothetical protein